MERKLRLKVHDRAFNHPFKKIWGDTSFFIVLKGGGSSGKSEMAFAKTLLRMILEDGHRFYGIRKVGKTIRNSSWQLLKDQIGRWGLGKLFRYRETDMFLECKINGNTWQGIGMDDREKIKSITEPTGFQIEEATELQEDDLNQLIIRMRGHTKNYKQIMLFFNPIDEFHWLRERFFPDYIEKYVKLRKFANLVNLVDIGDGDPVEMNALVSHTTYRDNAFITRQDRAAIEMFKQVNPQHYRIYGNGDWGRVEGLVYPKGYTIIQRDEYPTDYDEIVYGLDFGWVHPTSLSRYYLKTIVKGEVEILQSYTEELIYDKGLTTDDLIDLMKALEINPLDSIYADHQSAEKINQLQNAVDRDGQYLFNVLPADKDVKAGIDQLRMTERFSCPENVNHNKEIKLYRLKMDNKGRYEDYNVMKYFDDAMDNERYAIFTHSVVPELKMAFI